MQSVAVSKPVRASVAGPVSRRSTVKVVASASKRENSIASRVLPAVLAAVVGFSPVVISAPAYAGSPARQAIELLETKASDSPTPADVGGLKAYALKVLEQRTGSVPVPTGRTITAGNVKQATKETLGEVGNVGDALSNAGDKAKSALQNVKSSADSTAADLKGKAKKAVNDISS